VAGHTLFKNLPIAIRAPSAWNLPDGWCHATMDYLAHSLSKGRQLLLAVLEGVGLLVWKQTSNKALGRE
jgi:hypothetical protein